MKIVVLSDTHTLHDRIHIPDADLLIHAGDFSSNRGTLDDITTFNAFLAQLPHRHKIVVAGNHDLAFETAPAQARAQLSAATYLQDELIELAGLRIYGSPWQPRFFDYAFGLRRGAALYEKWQQIPPALDILITHTPPFGIGDQLRTGHHVGCEALSALLPTLRPTYHVFGHIHEGYGIIQHRQTTFINASICNVFGQPINPVICFEL